jgi:methyl-accepting chemotaxis protein
VDAALDGLAHAIAGKTESVGDEIERLREAIADVSGRIGTSADELATSADRLATTSARADESMSDLAHHAGAFKESLRDGTRLLDGLRELIASVERFIRPDGRR